MQTDSVSALRDLYRASEARAARLRLLMEAGRDLAQADAASLESTLALSARRAALFAGCQEGVVILGEAGEGLPLIAPGPENRRVGVLRLTGDSAVADQVDPEDRGALTLLAQLIAAAIDRVAQDQAREDLLQMLRERERRLEHVVGRLFSAQEEERRRVSHDLHDGVAQTATALFRRLEAGRADGAPDPASAELAAIAKSLVQELRRVIGGLRPTALDDLGLCAAVSAMAESLRREGYEVSFTMEGPERWPPVMETAFFRVAQEAFANIRKHAGGPCLVDVRLLGNLERQHWELLVSDQGVGPAREGPMEAERSPLEGEHIGLAVMRERMAAIGGRLELSNRRRRGFEVRAVAALGAQ